MTPVEIIALSFVVLAVVKVVVIFINPAFWKPVVKAVYAKPIYTTGVSLILGAVILWYLLAELTIVQIFASMTFMMTLMMLQFGSLGEEIMELSNKFLNDRSIMKKLWLPLTIWLVLVVWVAYEIFV